ncbi:MAG: hypothetical protein LUG52_09215 [Clostridia bacterium]|nr:hypothetical protein [Clostridia bacterium]
MKKFSKIFLVTAIAVIALFAMMTVASAATTISDVTASVATDEGRTISVTVTYDNPESAQQSTILVVPSTVTSVALVTDSDIKYIDQEAVDDTTVTYTFKLLSDDRTGVYNVYVGGTSVDAPSGTSFSFDTRSIIGTISVLGDATKATVVATDASGVNTSGSVESDGSYSVEVGQGTHTVVLGKANYLYKTIADVTVSDLNVDLGAATLYGGDFSGDAVIDLTDLQGALTVYGTSNSDYDLNDDGVTDLTDLQTVLINYNMSE